MSRLMHLLVLVGLTPFSGWAADWPQFRGANRDNVWNETGILQRFPAAGLKFRWSASVGPGNSSPVVADGRVCLTDSESKGTTNWERIQDTPDQAFADAKPYSLRQELDRVAL